MQKCCLRPVSMTIRLRGIRPLKASRLMLMLEEYSAGCRWFMTGRRDKEIDKHVLLCIAGFAVAFITSFI